MLFIWFLLNRPVLVQFHVYEEAFHIPYSIPSYNIKGKMQPFSLMDLHFFVIWLFTEHALVRTGEKQQSSTQFKPWRPIPFWDHTLTYNIYITDDN